MSTFGCLLRKLDVLFWFDVIWPYIIGAYLLWLTFETSILTTHDKEVAGVVMLWAGYYNALPRKS